MQEITKMSETEMAKDSQLLLVQKLLCSLPFCEVLDIFNWTDTFFISHGLRSGVFRIDW